MGSLAAAHLVRAGVGHVNVVNRSLPRAERLAEIIAAQGVGAQAMTLDDLPAALADADLVISCTGAVRPVVSLADVHNALAAGRRDALATPMVLCDLGMPRDVDPAVAGLPGVEVVDMDRVQREPSARAAAADAVDARRIVAAEVAAYLANQQVAEVTPTVTALRQRAADVVDTELFHELLGLIFPLLFRIGLSLHDGKDVIPDCESAENGLFLRQIAHAEAGTLEHGLVSSVFAIKIDFATIRLYKTDDHVKGGSLTCPVWSEQANDLARFDFDIDSVDDGTTIIDFFQPLGVEQPL
jgi:hypothetical protein